MGWKVLQKGQEGSGSSPGEVEGWGGHPRVQERIGRGREGSGFNPGGLGGLGGPPGGP